MVKISSGVDRESEKNSSEKLRLLSPNWFMRRRLVKLIRRLCAVCVLEMVRTF